VPAYRRQTVPEMGVVTSRDSLQTSRPPVIYQLESSNFLNLSTTNCK